MRRLSGQGEVHYDLAVPSPLHMPGLSTTSTQVEERGPHLPNVPQIDSPNDKSLPLALP